MSNFYVIQYAAVYALHFSVYQMQLKDDWQILVQN